MMRFDMRAPGFGATSTELHAAALEMAEWADSRGALAVAISEHHATEDGYLPSPFVLAAAMAARTSSVSLTVAAALLPLYDPIRLAEDLCVLDIVSEGRIGVVCGIGYRPEEYELYGVDFSRRGAIAEEKLELLLRAKTGEPFEHGGRTVRITPAPHTPGGPSVSWGGQSVAAARRAGRHGIGFIAQCAADGLEEAYEAAAREHGHEPLFCFLPPADLPTAVFVSDDPDRAWHELGPHLMHDVRTYAEWNPDPSGTASISYATTAEELRAENTTHRVVTVEEAVEMVQRDGMLQLHPLIGGLPPSVAWPYLQTVTDRVMPAVAAAAGSAERPG